jgi:Winged helix-turn helix
MPVSIASCARVRNHIACPSFPISPRATDRRHGQVIPKGPLVDSRGGFPNRGRADSSRRGRFASLAAVRDGMDRGSAAKIGGMDRQTLRDWVHRFNGSRLEGLVDAWKTADPAAVVKRLRTATPFESLARNASSPGGSSGSPGNWHSERAHELQLLGCELSCHPDSAYRVGRNARALGELRKPFLQRFRLVRS